MQQDNNGNNAHGKNAAMKLLTLLFAFGAGFLLAAFTLDTNHHVTGLDAEVALDLELAMADDDFMENRTISFQPERRLGLNSIKKSLNKAKSAAKKAESEVRSLKSKVGGLESKIRGLESKVRGLEGTIRTLKSQASTAANNAKNAASTAANKANDQASKITSLEGTIRTLKSQASSAATAAKNQATKITDLNAELKYLTTVKNTLEKTANKVGKTMESLPDILEKKVVGPIIKDVNSATGKMNDLQDIAENVADSTVNVMKQLDFLPKDGAELAGYLGDAVKKFFENGFCIPYDCLADKFEIDLKDIELYKSKRVEIKTEIVPETCLEVTDVAFDTQKLQSFLNIFKDLDALDDIFDAVRDFITDDMKKVLKYSDEVKDLLKDIKGVANNAANELGFVAKKAKKAKKIDPTRRHLLVTTHDDEPISMEEVGAMAYQKGHAKFQELYGEHVSRVFRERNLREQGANYIGFKALKLQFRQDFEQTITVEAKDRAGFAGHIFDESLHQETVFPVPMTGGMVKVVTSGSLETSMPYMFNMEAQGKARFKYDVGETKVNMDLVTGTVEKEQKEFKTGFDLDASVAISGAMSLNFAASSSIGLCLGPSQDACITVTIDASQTSAAGFDALAGISYDENPFQLTAMYTDEVEYEDKTMVCQGQLQVGAGYWQYVKEPDVKVAITGSDSCDSSSDTLYKRKGLMLQSYIENFCLATDLIQF